MSDRYVLVRVTDPNARWVWVTEFLSEEGDSPGEDYKIPVPEDDQLREDIMALYEWAEATYRQAIPGAHEQMLRPYVESARRLRAAAGLDQEDDHAE